MIKVIFLSIIINILLTFFSFGQDFEVSPVLISFTANPGESQNQTLTIRNHSNEKKTFSLNLADYIVDEQGIKRSVDVGSTPRTLNDWLTINPAFIELNPNETAGINLMMTVPANGYLTRWGMIQVEVAREQTPSDADKQLTTGVVLLPRIIVLVKQSARTNQNYKAEVSRLTEVTASGQKYRSFEAVITNTGDKVLDAKVYLALANLGTAEEQQFKPAQVTVYPEQQRKVSLTLPVELSKGQYAVAFLMDYGNRSAIEGAQLLLNVE
jgi:hypothetical protein